MGRGLVGRVRDDAECVDAAAHQRRDRRIDHPVPLQLRATGEGQGHQRHPVMAALPRARVTRMAGAVIDHLDGQWRERLLEGSANLADGRCTRNSFLDGSKRSRMISEMSGGALL
jgi:hypothetical protein